MKTIVLIEDDLDVQRIYSQKLELSGFKVILASDASQGYFLVKDLAPELVMLDIMLPGKMNGFELLEKIKSDEKLKNIPILVFTNLDTEKANALKAGASDYIIKSNTNLNEIVEKVEKQINFFSNHNTLSRLSCCPQ